MELQIFESPEFGKVRAIEIEGEPYFVGKDIADALGYAVPHKAIYDHCKGVLKRNTPTNSGVQEMSFIPESDVYRLIFRSKLPSAEKFETWVVSEVLPSIRKHGGYIAGQEQMSDEELMASALLLAKRKIDERDKQIEELNKQIELDSPLVLFAKCVSGSDKSILIRELAKLLKQNGIDIGEKRLFEWMRNNGYLIKSGRDRNMPTQRSMDLGVLEVKEGTYMDSNGYNKPTFTPKVTGKGQVYFINKFLEMKKKGEIA